MVVLSPDPLPEGTDAALSFGFQSEMLTVAGTYVVSAEYAESREQLTRVRPVGHAVTRSFRRESGGCPTTLMAGLLVAQMLPRQDLTLRSAASSFVLAPGEPEFVTLDSEPTPEHLTATNSAVRCW